MELCNGGSLQKILSEPATVYGLPEETFMDFFRQFSKFSNVFTVKHVA
jgi:hypothetical protein